MDKTQPHPPHIQWEKQYTIIKQQQNHRLRTDSSCSNWGGKEENTRCASFDINYTRQGFDNACWHREVYRDIKITRWVSLDIKFNRQDFENACWHREACLDKENTRWVSFDIKPNRQGFENACWHCEACQDKENTRWLFFDIKFTRPGFENPDVFWYQV